MLPTSIARAQTAIERSALSRPLRLAVENQLLSETDTVLDYGCGRGDDVKNLGALGIRCWGWDPVLSPDGQRDPADVVNLGFVVNVIEDPAERMAALRDAWRLTRKLLIVAGRLSFEGQNSRLGRYADGFLTQRGTFQKYYEQQELRGWIDEVLDESSVAAAPGVFYVFRSGELKESFLAARLRPRIALPERRVTPTVFERHKELFEALMGFMAARGRLPDDTELSEAQQIRANLGSLKKAFRLVCRMTGAEQWERIRQERSQDLLVYLALARFARRQPFSRLPPDLQRDVRAFFATYKHACSQADQLLFSPGDRQAVEEAFSNTPVGKLMPTALYLHESALVSLPPTLRIYEGCARALVGTIEGANIIKLHRSEPLVSYLAYPDFAGTAHPALIGSLAVHLQTFQVKYYDYSDSDNAPILHRKDTLVATSHPDYERFRALTVAEEGAGLLSAPDIGHRRSWERLLLERGLAIRDHQLIPLSDASGFERLPPAQGGGLD